MPGKPAQLVVPPCFHLLSPRVLQAMNFRDEDVPVDIDVLPGEVGNGRSEGQSLLVMSTRGFGKRVDTDEFKLTRRFSIRFSRRFFR